MVFDAAAVATAAELSSDDASDQHAEHGTDTAEPTVSADPDGDTQSEGNETEAAPQTGPVSLESAITDIDSNVGSSTQSIVFIDAALPDKNAIIESIDSSIEIVVLQSGIDGVGQIAEYLNGRSGIDSIQIFSHGQPGSISLGSTTLSTETIGNSGPLLAQIGAALSAEADILLYGCDAAAGAEGQAFITALAQATGADVAGSTNLSGSSDSGGDWTLELSTGEIEAVAVTPSAYSGVLAPIAITNVDGSTVTATTMAQTLVGSGITVLSATYSGAFTQSGIFSGASGYTNDWLSFDSGIVLTTGTTVGIAGANTAGGSGVDAAGTGTDADLGTIGAGTSFDAATLSFTFVPTSTQITMQFVFGSEEYNEYVYSTFNDAMGIWVNGVNYAVNPTGTPISIDTVNQASIYNPASGNQANDPNPANGTFDSSAPNLYIDNSPNSGKYATGMDGFTVTLSIVAPVNAGVANTVKIGVADIGDAFYDSYVFVSAGSMVGVPTANTDAITTGRDVPVVVDVLANDLAGSGGPLTITKVADKAITAGGPEVIFASGSKMSLGLDGKLTYTPASGATGTDLLTYTVEDQNGQSSVGFVDIEVVSNIAPTLDLNSNDLSPTVTVADSIVANSYSNSTGTSAWNGNWSEIGDDGTATNGDVRTISDGGRTVIDIRANSNGISRSANLSDHSSAILQFDYKRVSLDVFSDYVDVEVSADGTTFTNIGRLQGPANDSGYTSFAADVTGFISANTTVRFVSSAGMTNNDHVYIDNVVITATTPSTDYSTSYTENGAPVSVTAVTGAGVTISDIDSTNISGATITLTNAQAHDLLAVSGSLPTGITATVSPAGDTVELSGIATKAAYEAALEAITFSNSSEAPATVPRSISIHVHDDSGLTSNVGNATIQVIAVNDAPVDGNETNTAVEDTVLTVADGTSGDLLNDATDADGNPLTITGYTIAGITGTQLVGSPVAISGVGTIVINANGSYAFVPAADYNGGVPVITYTVSDGTATDTSTLSLSVSAVNDAPVDGNEARTAVEDTTLTIADGASGDLLNNATDVDGDALTITGFKIVGVTGTQAVGSPVAIPGVGTITVNANGSYAFVPAANYNGSVPVITYTVADGQGDTDTSTLTLSVSPVNDAPIASDYNLTSLEDLVISGDVTDTSSDVDGDTLSVTHVNGTPLTPGNTVSIPGGSLYMNPDGTMKFTPTANLTGTFGSIFTISDGNGGTDTATINVMLLPVNDAPSGTDTMITILEDGPRTFSATDFGFIDANDVPANTLDAIIVSTLPAQGLLTLSGVAVTAGQTITTAQIGNLTWTPPANASGNGIASFTFQVRDSGGTLNGGVNTDPTPNTVTFSIAAVNDAPVAANGALGTPEDVAVSGTLPVATDIDGDALTYAAGALAPSHGTVVVNPDGSFTYTPSANFDGSDSFTYTVSDGTALVERTMTVTVTPVNDAPVASSGSITVAEDGSLSSTLPVATDIDGDALTYAAGSTAPSHGTVSINGDGTFTYTPAANFNGSDTFTYTVSDGTAIVERTMTVNVTPVNDAPVASGGAITVAEDGSLSSTLPVATDIDGDALTYAAGSTAPSHGTVTINGDGTFTYTPAANYNGADTFTYTVSDGTATVERTMTITVSAINDAPVASSGSITVAEDGSLSSTLPVATDIDGDALTYAVGSTAPSHGTVTINGDGTFTYTPAANFNGSDTFTYTVSDGTALVEQTMTVNVTPANDAPVASGGAITVAEDGSLSSTLPVATDIDGDALIYAAGTAPSHGTVVVNPDGSFTYTPAANYNGSDTFTYTVSDGTALVERTMTVNVTPANDAPVASGGSITVAEDGSLSSTLPVATDIDGDALIYAAGTAPSHGTVTINGDGTFTYTPAANYNGADTFTYTVSDGTAIVERTMTVTVTPVNDAPVASSGSITVAEDGSLSSTLPVATDIDGDALIYAAGSTAPSHGTVTINGDGTFTYTPAANYNGSDTFTYTVSDGTAIVERTMTVTVTPVNDAPVASSGSITVAEDGSLSSTLPVATDIDGDALTYAAGSTAPSHGTVTINGDGTFTYTPAANFNGSDTFTYTVSDGTAIVERTMTVTVSPVNDAPVASKDEFITLEDTPITFEVRTNDADLETTPLIVTAINGTEIAKGSAVPVTGGVVRLNSNGTLTFSPAAGWNGTLTFTYTVTDGANTSTTTVVGTVQPATDVALPHSGLLQNTNIAEDASQPTQEAAYTSVSGVILSCVEELEGLSALGAQLCTISEDWLSGALVSERHQLTSTHELISRAALFGKIKSEISSDSSTPTPNVGAESEFALALSDGREVALGISTTVNKNCIAIEVAPSLGFTTNITISGPDISGIDPVMELNSENVLIAGFTDSTFALNIEVEYIEDGTVVMRRNFVVDLTTGIASPAPEALGPKPHLAPLRSLNLQFPADLESLSVALTKAASTH